MVMAIDPFSRSPFRRVLWSVLVTVGVAPPCHLTITASTGLASKADLYSALGSNPGGAQAHCMESKRQKRIANAAGDGMLHTEFESSGTQAHCME